MSNKERSCRRIAFVFPDILRDAKISLPVLPRLYAKRIFAKERRKGKRTHAFSGKAETEILFLRPHNSRKSNKHFRKEGSKNRLVLLFFRGCELAVRYVSDRTDAGAVG